MNDLLVQKKMNFALMPSLKHIACVKITLALWNKSHIRDLFARCYTPDPDDSPPWVEDEEWQVIDNKVAEQVPKLPLPELLKKEILDFIPRISQETVRWIYHRGKNIGVKVPEALCWTPQGTVDGKKTAEVFVKDESIDFTTRYRLACIYCLEDDVKKLWNSMPERERDNFYNKFDPSEVCEDRWIVFWCYDMMGDLLKFSYWSKEIYGTDLSPYQYAFEYCLSMDYGTKEAAEYYLQKLTPVERVESFASIKTGSQIRNADTMCFLLSQMDEEQQSKVVEGDPVGVLSNLLDWPWQIIFMETANRVWDVLSKDDYEQLLIMIVYMIGDGFNDYNYHKLFAEFWQQSPDSLKKCIINESEILLSELFEIEDKENVRLILKNATVEQREEIIFHSKGQYICEKLIFRNKWDLLKFFVQECIPSVDSMIEFKEEFRKLPKLLLSEHEDLLAKFFQFLDDLIHKDNEKRGMEEGSL